VLTEAPMPDISIRTLSLVASAAEAMAREFRTRRTANYDDSHQHERKPLVSPKWAHKALGPYSSASSLCWPNLKIRYSSKESRNNIAISCQSVKAPDKTAENKTKSLDSEAA
jgi:hypothetical protein